MLSRYSAALRVASAALHAPASAGLPRTAAGAAQITRDPRFNTVTESDLARFRGILGASAVVTDEAELAAYNEDWLKKFTGASRVALKPKTTAQVSAVLAHCNERRLAVVPQGGNTGLVGGSGACTRYVSHRSCAHTTDAHAHAAYWTRIGPNRHSNYHTSSC